MRINVKSLIESCPIRIKTSADIDKIGIRWRSMLDPEISNTTGLIEDQGVKDSSNSVYEKNDWALRH